MSAVYCRECGTRVTDQFWRSCGFCDHTCRERYDAPPVPIEMSPGTFMEFGSDEPLIQRPALEKARELRADPDRYFRIVRAQRDAEVRGWPIPTDDEAMRGDQS